MKIDIKNEGTLFYFDELDKSKGFIEIRPLTSKVLKEITRKTEKKKYVYKRGQRFEELKVDEDLRDKLYYDYIIINWEGLEDQDGNIIECTSDNKVMVVENSPFFASFIADCIEKLNEQELRDKEVTEKN